jgi:hypothetical protein
MALIRIPGFINAFVVENIRQLRELERHPHVSPVLSPRGGLMHRVLASQLSRDVLYPDRELPAVESGSSETLRGFDPDALTLAGGELYKMASYVAGSDRGDDLESVVQRWLARRFDPRYEDSPSVCAAARLLGSWHRRGPLSACLARGRLGQAKALLSASMAAELEAAYAPTLLLPYVVMCLERMRKVARDPLVVERLSPELVVSGCLAAPRLAFRSCTRRVEVSFLPRALPAHTLLVLPTRRLRAAGDGSSAFGSDDASRYPALRLIRRLLTEVWIASRDVYHPVARSNAAIGVELSAALEQRAVTSQTTLVFDLARRSDASRQDPARSGTRRRRSRRTARPIEPRLPL